MINLSELDPRKIMLAGDWHGNTRWALSCINKAALWLASEEHKIIVQLGDFGIWGEELGEYYRQALSEEAKRLGVIIVFLDGNHEDHPLLHRLTGGETVQLGHLPQVAQNIYWAFRGAQWNWQGHSWVALGGAVSPDRASRREGWSWFPEEEISVIQAGLVSLGGHSDVMITHDCPSGVTHSFSNSYGFDLKDIARCEWHRELLQGVVDYVTPSWLFHGHLHRGYVREVTMKHGKVMVCGLDMDTKEMNVAILDTKSMEFALPEEP